MRKRIALILWALIFTSGVLNTAFVSASEAELLLRLDFEDEITGNNSIIRDPRRLAGWGEARTMMARGGSAWSPEHRVEGKTGHAYYFGGDEELRYVQIPYSEELAFGMDNFSIAFWLKTETAPGHIMVRTTRAPYWLIGIRDDGRLQFLIRDGESSVTNAVRTREEVNDGRWNHVVIAAQRDGSATLYVNGHRDNSADISANNGDLSKPAGIGVGGFGHHENNYEGLLGGLRLYRGLLSHNEVIELYEEFD